MKDSDLNTRFKGSTDFGKPGASSRSQISVHSRPKTQSMSGSSAGYVRSGRFSKMAGAGKSIREQNNYVSSDPAKFFTSDKVYTNYTNTSLTKE